MGDAERVDADRLRGARSHCCARSRGARSSPRTAASVISLRDAELPDELQRPPFEARVADLGGDREGSPRRAPHRERACRCGSRSPRRRAAPPLAASSGDRRRRRARPRNVALPSWRSIRRSQNGSRATQRRSASSGSCSSSVSSAARRFAAVAVEPRRVLAAARRARAPSRRGARQPRCLAGFREPLARVQPHGLEQAVAAVTAGVVDGDERLLDEAARGRPRSPRLRELVVRADRLDRVELEAAGEDGEPAEQRPARQARAGRGSTGASPRASAGVSARRGCPAQEPETIVEPLGDRRGLERSEPAGGELERERQAVEPEADASDVLRVLVVEHEAGRSRRRPARRRAGPPRSGEARRERARCSGSGMSSDGTRNTTSPGTRSGSRLVARIVSCGAERSSASASASVAASTCSQLSSTSSSVRGARTSTTASTELLPGERADVERGGDRVRHEARGRRAQRARRAPHRPRTTARRRARARARAASCRRHPSRTA